MFQSAQTLPLPAHFPPGFADVGSALAQRSLCANGRPYVTDPSTGQPVCLCQLGGVGLPFPAAHGTSPGARNSPTSSPVGMQLPPMTAAQSVQLASAGFVKDSSTRTIPLGGPYTAAALAYHPYLYAGLEAGSIRKAAVRETTGPLKAWLHEHRKNPYPTKAEKIMLAIITQMTLTQVSTWFANARRRLKKENRGGWDGSHDNGPHSDADDDGDDKVLHSDDDNHTETRDGDSERSQGRCDDFSDVSVDDDEDDHHQALRRFPQPKGDNSSTGGHSPQLPTHASFPLRPEATSAHERNAIQNGVEVPANNNPAPKPRIWSISAIIGLDESKDSSATRDSASTGGSCASSNSEEDKKSAAEDKKNSSSSSSSS